MDKKMLKELKRQYKAIRLGVSQGDLADLEEKLKGEMGEEGWANFLVDVEQFQNEVQALCRKIVERGKDTAHAMVAAEWADVLKDANRLGGGAAILAKQVWEQAMAEHEAARPVADNLEPEEPLYWTLPRDWEFSYRSEKNKACLAKLESLLYRYSWVGLWNGSSSRDEELEKLRRMIFSAGSGKDVKIDEELGMADRWVELARPVAQTALEQDEIDDETQDRLSRLGNPAPFYVKISKQKQRDFKKSFTARGKHVVNIQNPAKSNGEMEFLPGKDARPLDDDSLCACSGRRNDITGLAPSSSWTIYLDESYRGHDAEAFMTGGTGVMAGVIFHSDEPLPDLPELHCSTDYAEADLEAADKAVETILLHPNCGVLVVPSMAYDAAMGWDDMVASWVDVVLRLLPMPKDGSMVDVKICVEPSGAFQREEDYVGLKLVCEKSLKQVFPERAQRVNLSFKLLPKPKKGQRNGNAYPDVVGHTCMQHSRDETARQRYQAAGWSGCCHLNLDAYRLRRLLRAFYRRESLDSEAWSAVVQASTTGLLGALSARIGERTQQDVKEWTTYLGYLHSHLASGAIDMVLLKQQVAWMKKYECKGMSKRSRLVWLTAKLALANHQGKVKAKRGTAVRAEFDSLSEELFDEMAPVVCDATLHLAVAYTNEYQFEMALGLIHSLMTKDKATVGLANHGKLLSSAGQHFAFMGMAEEAIDHFRQALACFARLTEQKVLNTTITRAYLTTATMDFVPEDARAKLALYLLGSEKASNKAMLDKIRILATNPEGDKFQHHILLRYLVTLPEADALRQAYCEQEPKWCEAAVGHPWELIEFYRALLSSDPGSRSRRFENAFHNAINDEGETLKVIAAVIAGSALALELEGNWQNRLAQLCADIKLISGLHADGRYEALVDQPKAKLPPLQLAAKVLPFNFR